MKLQAINQEEHLHNFNIRRVKDDTTLILLDRVAYLLHFEWGFSNAEIADLFSATRTGIQERIQRVQESLYEGVSKYSCHQKKKTDSGGTQITQGEMADLLPKEEEGKPNLFLRQEQEVEEIQSITLDGYL